jgi:hypothetical protein
MKGRQQKALAEQRHEFRQWKRWRRERFEELLEGPYAEPARALVEFCKTTMTGPTALINFIAAGPWSTADMDTRIEILAFVDAVIIKQRERMGLPPFSDPLPGQPTNAFLILRAQLANHSRFIAAPPGLISETLSIRKQQNGE